VRLYLVSAVYYGCCSADGKIGRVYDESFIFIANGETKKQIKEAAFTAVTSRPPINPKQPKDNWFKHFEFKIKRLPWVSIKNRVSTKKNIAEIPTTHIDFRKLDL